MTCGIYRILNTENNKSYIGSSISIEFRWKQHIGTLKRGTHRNIHLQRSFDEHGIDKFSFSIVEETSKEKLLEREAYWMQFYRVTEKEFGYNLYKNPLRPGYEKGKVPVEIRDRIGTDNRLVSFVSPDGIVFDNIKNVTRFAQEHNLLPANMNAVARKELGTHHGWKLYESGLDFSTGGRKRKSGTFNINLIDKLGNIFHVSNLQKFCEENNLKQGTMYRMVSGGRKSSQGFRLFSGI